MKIIRWLLSHTILILLIVAVIYGYMFWGNLIGEDTPAGKAVAYLSEEFEEVADFVDAVKAKQAGSSQSESAEPQLSATDDSVEVARNEPARVEPEAETAVSGGTGSDSEDQSLSVDEVTGDGAVQEEVAQVEAAPDTSTETAVETQPVSISYSHNDMHIMQNSDGVIESTRETVVVEQNEGQPNSGSEQETVAVATATSVSSAPALRAESASNVAEVKHAEKFVSPDIKEQLDNVDEHGKVIDESKNESLRDSWIKARKSFYQRNYPLSEQSYQKVINNSKDNFDAYGELGNVYFNQGKNQQAASAYFEAAAILVKQGQINRARSLMGLLRHLDRSKAIELQKLMDSSVS
ncbi:MAG TPA: tetratricopeptide repeat protein [Gammaproteobacteria bacterium]|nr:tetratricopeptide repeat protein [Gammaproteobacteria bacterium]